MSKPFIQNHLPFVFRSLAKDPVAPILAYKHYPAMERRFHKIMVAILDCLDKSHGGVESVVMHEFHNRMIPEPETNNNAEEDESEEEDEKKQDANANADTNKKN